MIKFISEEVAPLSYFVIKSGISYLKLLFPFFLYVSCYNSAPQFLRPLFHACIKIPIRMLLHFRNATGPGMGYCRITMAEQHIHLEAFCIWLQLKKKGGMGCRQSFKVKIKNCVLSSGLAFLTSCCITCVWMFLKFNDNHYF